MTSVVDHGRERPRRGVLLCCWAIGLLALSSCVAKAPEQAPANELAGDLEPMDSALTYHTPAYHLNLRQVLMSQAPRYCEVQFLAFPSFQPETLLSIYRAGDEYEAQVLTPVTQVWDREGAVSEIACKETKKHLPTPTAERIGKIWKSMLRRTRHTEARSHALDGIKYVFLRYERGLGSWSGELRNPEEGTRPYVLAEIGTAVIAFVHASPTEEQARLSEVAKALDRLEPSLEAK